VLLSDIPAQAVIADKAYDADERVIKPLKNAGKQIVSRLRQTATCNALTTNISTRHRI